MKKKYGRLPLPSEASRIFLTETIHELSVTEWFFKRTRKGYSDALFH